MIHVWAKELHKATLMNSVIEMQNAFKQAQAKRKMEFEAFQRRYDLETKLYRARLEQSEIVAKDSDDITDLSKVEDVEKDNCNQIVLVRSN